MKNTTRLKSFAFLFLLFICITGVFTSCSKDEVDPSKQEYLLVNNFIWESMNDYYFWEEQLPTNIDRTREKDPEDYFYKLLYRPTDRFSFILDSYDDLVNMLNGIEKTIGVNFKLYKLNETSNDILGIVRYVLPDSPADNAEIKRGDIFYKVDGTKLTTLNYSSLLYNKDSYTLTFGEINEGGLINETTSHNLTAVIINEDPIHYHDVIEYAGHKIAYLSYNQFISEYDNDLKSVIQGFISEGASDLVLDLRYNPGGSMSTAILLSSMIAPKSVTSANSVLAYINWNDQLQKYWELTQGTESENLVSRFLDTDTNMNLSRVYVITSSNTASASELLINCLSPYMEVILIGSENTVGKNVGSITIYDTEKRHDWAIQPIVTTISNSNMDSNYTDGFAPDYQVKDDVSAELGSIYEDMLTKAIELITGEVIADPGRHASTGIPENAQSVASGSNKPSEKKEILNLDNIIRK